MSATMHIPVSPRALVEEHRKRVDLVAQCANEASPAEFDRKWMSVLLRCAGWFSSLPLNAAFYREPGGAFRFTIETAFYAMRLAGGQKFGTSLTSEKRRRIEPQYNYAVFLAAVCSGLDEPYRHFVVTRERDAAVWNPSAHGGAAPWLGDAPYRVGLRDAALPVERMRTGMLAQMLVGLDLLGGLDAEVLAELFGAINPNPRPLDAESLTHKVVRQAIVTAEDFDRKAQRAVFEPVKFTVPPAIDVAALLQPVQALQPAVTPASGAAQPVPAAGAGAPEAPEGAPPEHSHTPAASVAARLHAKAADQLGLPFVADGAPTPASGAVNPADIPSVSGPQRQIPATGHQAFDNVLDGAPNIIRELFRALREDVARGKAKVAWSEQGLVLTKRLIGSYGVTSETLVEHLRRRNLLLTNENGEITLAPRAGELILERSGS